MSEALNYPNFYQPVAGRPSPRAEQLMDTTQSFNELFDDVMLQNMGAVRQFDYYTDMPVAHLLTHLEVGGQEYSLVLKDNASNVDSLTATGTIFTPSQTTKRDITLQRIAGGRGRECWSYRLGADGVVRRWDAGAANAQPQPITERGRDDGDKTASGKTLQDKIGLIAVKNLNILIGNKFLNNSLAEDMGLNNQPVDLEEMVGLRDFLQIAG
ncbi:MAG: hypothetical protein ABI602_03005 [Candidatus Saccharibacteria bacterium]